MTQQEQRREERIKFLMPPRDELHITFDGERFAVPAVLNISSQGISLQLERQIDTSSEVVLHYRHKDINMNVNGTVVWNKPNGQDPKEPGKRLYNIGINLLGPHMLFSLMQT
ncbi:MAG: PilZ domain-containing protein [Gallionella sp.]